MSGVISLRLVRDPDDDGWLEGKERPSHQFNQTFARISSLSHKTALASSADAQFDYRRHHPNKGSSFHTEQPKAKL